MNQATTTILKSQAELIELAYVAMIVRDLDSRIMFWNRRAEQVYGWTKDEAIGQVTHALLSTRFPISLAATDEELQRSGHWEGKLLHTTRGGQQIVVLSRQAIQQDRSGRPAAILEVNLDITEQEKARAALEESQERFRNLAETVRRQAKLLDEVLSASPDHFYMYDRSGSYLYANASATQALGISREEIIGKDWQELGFPAEIMRPFEAQRAHVLETGEPQTGELRFPVLAGIRDYEYTLSPIHGADNSVESVVATVRDITLRKQAEEEVRRLNRELEERVRDRTARLETANRELEAFSYSVSHDLRTPLRAIDGFSRILIEDYASKLDGEALEYLNLVRENTRQMGHLIDDLLAFSRLGRQEVRRQRVDTGAVARAAWESLSPFRQGREFEVVIAEMPVCLADPTLLQQVFTNLLSNAIKYTRPRKTAHIEVGSRMQDGETVFFVHDDGVGFEQQYAGKLFGVFQRLHRADEYEGTGVGLAIVQRIVHRHGGRVWAEGALEQGSAFYFTLGDTCYA